MKPYTKKEMEEKAVQHTKDMAEEFSFDITESIQNSKVFRGNVNIDPDGETTHVIFDDTTTSKSIFRAVFQDCPNVTALNYASYKYPGGGFIKGSTAQEEALCHDSTLYNVIGDKKFEKEYLKNREDLHKSLYTDFAIFSPDIVFVDDEDWVKANILTCPSPNYKVAHELGITYEENLNCLKKRAEFMIKVAKISGTKTLILGAWGCGVFGQNVMDLAHVFKALLSKYKFDTVIFAIPDKDKMEKFKLAYDK